MSGERLTTRLRVQLFKTMLNQTIGWHDEKEHTTGSLATILSVDTNNVKNVSSLGINFLFHLQLHICCLFSLCVQGTGIQLGSIFLATTSVLMTVVVSFYSSWELALMLIVAFPLIFVSYRLSHNLYYSTGDNDYLQASAHVVLETVKYIKTVVTLQAGDYFINSVNEYLRLHTRYLLITTISLPFTHDL